MTIENAIYCLKADSELHSEICEECKLYGQTGTDHCYDEALDMAIKSLEAWELIKVDIRHFMLEVNPSSSESDYACNYILDIIDKHLHEIESEVGK